MNEINQALLEIIDELKEIVWRVNCRLKSVRQVVQLERGYSETVIAWTDKINQLVMSENHAKTIEHELRVAGYTTPVMKMTETNLLMMLDSFTTGKYNIILYTANRKAEIIDMPMLVDEINQMVKQSRKLPNGLSLLLVDHWHHNLSFMLREDVPFPRELNLHQETILQRS